MYDVLIIGGGVAGVSCALVLGSAYKKTFMLDKKIGFVAHQKSGNLQDAVLNNVYGISPGTLGSDLMNQNIEHLKSTYPHIEQISNEKVVKIYKDKEIFQVYTNENIYETKIVVIAVGASNTFNIEGLEQYIENHKKSIPEKNRIQLKNNDHLVETGIYVTGVLAGHRSQVAIAAGSGAAVATDILTLWNSAIQTHAHDSLRRK